MVSTGSRQPSMAPYTSILPTRGSMGMRLRWRPSAVSSSSASNAPISASIRVAPSTAATGGGVRQRWSTLPTPPTPAAPDRSSWPAMPLISSATRSSGLRDISGLVWGGIDAHVAVENMRKHTPGRTRPARPRRCCAAARLTHPSCSRRMPRSASCDISLARPQSTTNETSSIVIDVSATLVAMTILVVPGGGRAKTFVWSPEDSEPCSGSTRTLDRPPAADASLSLAISARCSRLISGAPGRNTSTAPPGFLLASLRYCAASGQSPRKAWAPSARCRATSSVMRSVSAS
mmetsp:Transcript_9675/g.29316  ORF Transcript_9675/g.29316 Transcript_9675/m.29316 type:complete len:290 (+) Transcript_9675:1247-2116(+)